MKKQTKPPKIIVSQESQDCFFKAVKLYDAGDMQGAANICEMAIKLSPNHSDALHLLGVILAGAKQFIPALGFFNESIKLNPVNFVAYSNRANLFQALKQPELALDDFDKAIELNPNYAEAYYNKGIVMGSLHKIEEEVALYDKALALQPKFPEAYNNKGIALQKLHRMEDTLNCYQAGINQNPKHVEAFYNNRGLVLQNLMRVEEALEDYNKAIEIKSDLEDARFNRSLCLLLLGKYDTAWEEHEWRWKRAIYPRRIHEKLWLGGEPIKDKVLFIHGEQGLGDMLQFCRYAKLAKAQGAVVVLGIEKPLLELVSYALEDCVDLLVTPGDKTPHFDLQVPIMSLPLAFGTTSLDLIPNEPYLKADPIKVAYWERKLGPKKKKRVGVVWSGGYRPDQPEVWAVNERRNISLDKLSPLFDVDVEFYSLQKGEPAESELASSQYKDKLINYTAGLKNFSDTAALVECLDLVICVDTSTCHLAAAMGKQTWMLNRFDTCWRWLIDRNDSPWYPSLTQFRQPKLGDWGSVVEAVKKYLAVL